MKDAIKLKLLVIGLLIVLFSACSFAQSGFDTNLFKSKKEIRQLDKETIKLDLSITIDNQVINDTMYTLEVYNKTTKDKHILNVSNKFILYLKYNSEFEVSIKYNNTSMKTIYIDTEASYNNWYIITSINLKSNSNENIIAGGIRYNGKLQTFEKYKL